MTTVKTGQIVLYDLISNEIIEQSDCLKTDEEEVRELLRTMQQEYIEPSDKGDTVSVKDIRIKDKNDKEYDAIMAMSDADFTHIYIKKKRK